MACRRLAMRRLPLAVTPRAPYMSTAALSATSVSSYRQASVRSFSRLSQYNSGLLGSASKFVSFYFFLVSEYYSLLVLGWVAYLSSQCL